MKGMPMMRIAAGLLLAMAWLHASPAAAQDKDGGRKLDELMHKSGMWKQIAQMEPLVQMGIAQAHERERGKPGGLDDFGLARIKAAAASAFDANRLRREFAAQMASELSLADEREVLAWLSTGLGKRFTALEEESGELDAVMKRDKEGHAYFATLPAARVERFKRLAKAVRIGESGAGIMINTTVGIAYGFALATPPGDTSGAEALKRQLESQRTRMVAAMEASSVEDFAFIYRDVADADLERYIAFTETPAGRNYAAASLRALDKILTRASLEFGAQLGGPKPEGGRLS
jgi:hypothetical protein